MLKHIQNGSAPVRNAQYGSSRINDSSSNRLAATPRCAFQAR